MLTALFTELRERFSPPPAPAVLPVSYRCCAMKITSQCDGIMQPIATHPTEGALFRCTACLREAFE